MVDPGAREQSAVLLEAAAANGDIAAVQALLAQGATPTPTAAYYAIVAASSECFTAVLDAGVDPRAVDGWGVPLLMAAAAAGHPALHTFLADPEHTDPTQKGWPEHSLKVGHGEILWLLLDRGANPNIRHTPLDGSPGAGLTPLMVAAAFGNTPGVDVLVARGADMRAVDLSARNARHWAERFGHRAIMDRMRALAKRG